MKIAIMTQPLGTNYGGIMQAWALQQVLKHMGHEPVTIARREAPKGHVYHAARLGYRALKKAMGKRQAPINFERYLPAITQHTRAFIDQHITMSEPLDSTAKLKAHFDREQYDAVIVGSDQTWRPQYSPCIENFFLDFLEGTDIKRIAYAASFGVGIWEFTEAQTKRCAALANHFDAISVRENSGLDLCRNYLGVEANHVLDPALMLEKEYYENLLYQEKIDPRSNCIYTYFLDKTPEKYDFAHKLSRLLDKPLISHQATHGLNEDISGSPEPFTMPDVRKWIGGFAEAEFVLTDSFHGVVFSIIFEKPFYAIVNIERGADRFYSLLITLGLTDRLITLDHSEPNSSCHTEIDWQSALKKLEAMKEKSKIYLEGFLQDEKNGI